jgi:hypothetical protein
VKRAELRRTTPLERRTPLTSRLARETVLERRARLTPVRRRPVKGRADAAAAFRDQVLEEACIACGSAGPRDAHHAVPAQELRRICRSLGLSDDEALAVVYAPAVGVALCSAGTTRRCHERHTNAVGRVAGHLLPERVYVFAADLGPAALAALEREHPGARATHGHDDDAGDAT